MDTLFMSQTYSHVRHGSMTVKARLCVGARPGTGTHLK